METLAYLHLALAEDSEDSLDCTTEISSWKKPQFLTWLDWPHLSTSAAIQLLSLTIVVGILGIARQASALTQLGDRGPEVTVLQERLLELGYFKGEISGYYGSMTDEAVKKFQQAKGLTPDGVVGTNTQAALEGPVIKESNSNKETLRLGDRGEQVSNLQQKLAVAGFAVNSQKGSFDEETEAAVRQFQQAKGLMVDGIVGQQTLSVLTTSNLKETAQDSLKELPKEKTPAPKKGMSWYEDKSAPLQPFIERQN
jgi:peptidoglycan hydrolase-like protein with peptidoglycan-binding domain